MSDSGKTYQPIRWVVVRTCNFSGHQFVEELCQRRSPALARVEVYYEWDTEGHYQFEAMRSDEAFHAGIKGPGVTEKVEQKVNALRY